jgi:hypothetical protein
MLNYISTPRVFNPVAVKSSMQPSYQFHSPSLLRRRMSWPRETSEPGTSTQSCRGSAGSISGVGASTTSGCTRSGARRGCRGPLPRKQKG